LSTSRSRFALRCASQPGWSPFPSCDTIGAVRPSWSPTSRCARHVGLHCLLAFVQVAGWARAGELASHLGYPWLTSGAAFEARLSRLTGIAVGGRGRPDITG